MIKEHLKRGIRIINQDTGVRYFFVDDAFVGFIEKNTPYDGIQEVQIIFKEFEIQAFMHLGDILQLEQFISLYADEDEEDDDKYWVDLNIYSTAEGYENNNQERKLLKALQDTIKEKTDFASL